MKIMYRNNHSLLNAGVVLPFILCMALLLASPQALSANIKAVDKDGKASSSIVVSEPGLELGDNWLDPYLKQKSLDRLFKSVAEQVRFEPYAGMLRGVMGTAISRRGNSLDQSLLLKHVLAQQGYQVRLVTGQLDNSNALTLLRGMYPPQIPSFGFSKSYDPFKLETSGRLVQAVQKHYWVEVNQGDDSWLPLDPSFPRAKIGEAYARAEQVYQQAQDDWKQVISIRLLQKTIKNKTTTLFDVEVPVAEIGYMPLSLSSIGIPLEQPTEKSKEKSSAKGLFGKSLKDGTSSKAEPAQSESAGKILGTRYNWALRIRGHGSSEIAHTVQFNKAATLIAKEWLELTIKAPGQDDRRIERVLFDATDARPEHQPPLYRRYVLEVFPGAVRPELAQSMHEQFSKLPLDAWKASLTQSQKNGDSSAVLAMDEALASSLLQMILTRFAEASDEASDRAAYRNAVAVIRSTPRVLIASVELDGQELVFSMDLRLDEVDAIPFPGAPSKIARLFQMGRGVLQSTAEGEVLQQLTGNQVLTTASLMARAQAANITLKVVDASQLNRYVKQSKIPKDIRQALSSSVTKNSEIIIPEQAVRVAGVERWGWWLVDKPSGRTIGVMDNGLHAGMAEYTISTTEINLDPRMGFVVGMVVGADATLFTISGLMLKHGQATPAMIKEVKEYLDNVLCSSCPQAGASASASYSAGDDCLSVEKSVGVSAKVSIDFCEEYVNGFKCAAGLLMAGLTGESGRKEEAKVEAAYSAGCKGGSAEAGFSRDY